MAGEISKITYSKLHLARRSLFESDIIPDYREFIAHKLQPSVVVYQEY